MEDPTALYERSKRRPGAVDRSEVATLGEYLASDADPDLQAAAVGTVAEATRADPRVGVPVVPELSDLVTDEHSAVRRPAVAALARIASAHPDAVATAVDSLVEGVAVEDDPDYRSRHVLAVARVAEGGGRTGLQAVGPVTDRLVELLAAELPVRAAAARAIAAVAVEDPQEVRDAVPDLVAHLDAPVGGLRVDAARAIAAVAGADPDRIVAHVDPLIEAVDDENPRVRRAATEALAALALSDPPAVAPRDDVLFSLLADESAGDAAVEGLMGTSVTEPGATARRLAATVADADSDRARDNAERTLRGIAMRNPDPVVEALADVLDHDRRSVRRTAVEILGAIASHRPGRVVGVADRIAGRLDDGDDVGREAAGALLAMASDRPEDLVDAAGALSAHVERSGPVYPDAVRALAAILEARPDAVERPPRVETLLSADEDAVRAGACRILGATGDETALPRLRDRTEEGPRTVRVAALEGMARLAERGEVTLEDGDRERIAALDVSIDDPESEE